METHQEKTSPAGERKIFSQFFAALAGIFFGIALLKFGNPVILDKLVEAPKGWLEILFQAWPVKWGYFMLTPVAITGLLSLRWKAEIPKWILLLPLIWLGWQFLAAIQTVDASLTTAALKHFSVCILFFYFGCFALRGGRKVWPLWVGLLIAFGLVLRAGFDQHFGGLEETRRFFYQQPGWQSYPPDFLKKISSDRIFSTLFYPNTLAGAILLLLPVCLVFIWHACAKLAAAVRDVFLVLFGVSALACLYWSGSKAGWLLALISILVALAIARIQLRWKIYIAVGLLVCGLAGFALKYAKFFERGSTSVVARFDYWKAAVKIVRANPLLGTGPGTFSASYQKIKNPNSEMARLCHNDYLQQATDSGLIGALAYAGFVLGSLVILFRRVWRNVDTIPFAVWLGLLGVSLHSFVEFHLYIPALGWLVFFLFGWLWNLPAPTNPSTNIKAESNLAAAR